jgi:hypothetical protein
MKTALLAACVVWALSFHAAAKDSSERYRIIEIPMFPDAPPEGVFDHHITALNDRGQMTVLIPLVRPDPDHSGEYSMDHLESRFWDGHKWWRVARGSNDTIAIDVNNRGEVLAVTDVIKQPIPFELQYTPFTWRRGITTPIHLAFDNATVRHWSQRGDLAGDYHILEICCTNLDGMVITSQVSRPFLVRDGNYVDLAAAARAALLNRFGDALIVSEGSYPAGHPLQSSRLTFLTRRGTNDLQPPDGWNIWPWFMGDKSFAGKFIHPVTPPSGLWNEGLFVYDDGKFVSLVRSNEVFGFLGGMNDRGDVVGYVADGNIHQWPDDMKGFLYRKGERRFIHDLVRHSPDWKLFYPDAINNRGEMAGFGRRHGRLALYLLKPEKH